MSYRVIAYRTAAKAVRDASVSIMAMTREGTVTSLPGIGKTLEEKLRALDETGDIPSAVKLRAKFPTGLIAVMHLPDFGPKRARLLYDELGIDSLESLRAAAEKGEIRKLRGFGAKVEENLLRILAEHEDGGGPGAADSAFPRAAGGRADRRRAARPPGRRPGRDRRLAAPDGRLGQGHRHHRDGERRVRAGLHARRELELVESVQQSGDAGARVMTHSGMKVDLKVVEPDQFGNVLQHFTGAKAHNVQLREAAVRRGLHVSEYGILDDETGETTALRDRGGGLRAARAWPGSRRSCARAAASSRRRPRARCRRWSRWRTCAATCTATRRSPTAARRSSRWSRRRASAAGSTWRSPTTRPRTGSATT